MVTRIRKRDNAWEEVGKTGEVVKRKREREREKEKEREREREKGDRSVNVELERKRLEGTSLEIQRSRQSRRFHNAPPRDK